jgi:hypothetical protein
LAVDKSKPRKRRRPDRPARSPEGLDYDPRPGQPVSDLLPERPTLKAVREIAAGCKACDLHARGTQTLRRFVADLKKVAARL